MAQHRRFAILCGFCLVALAVTAFTGCAAHKAASLREKGAQSLASQDLVQAEAHYRQSLEYEESAEAHAQLGHALALENNCLDALQHLTRGLKAEELKEQVTTDLARCYRAIGNFPDAAERYVQAIELSPQRHEISVETADFWPHLYKDARVEAWIRRIIAAQPDMHYGWAYLGNYYYDKGQLELARNAYLKALEVFPRSVPVLVRLAGVYALSRQSTKALENYDAALKLEPEDSSAKYGKAAVFAQMGRAKEALELLSAIFEKEPDHAYANALTAQIFLMQGNPNAALEHGKRALASLPDNVALVKLTARAALAARQPAEAVATLDPTIARGATDAEVFEILGNAREESGDMEGARQAYTRAITLDPQRPGAHIALGTLYFKQRIYAAAAATLSEGARLAPENGPVWFTLGRAYVEMGKGAYPEAAKALARATEISPDNAEAWAYFAAVLVAERRQDEGLSALEKAAQLGFADSAFLERSDFEDVRPNARFKMISGLISTNEQASFAAPDLVPLAPLPQ